MCVDAGKILLAFVTYRFQFVCVHPDDKRPSECKRDLDSKLQRRHGVRLNTSRLARAACGVVGLRIAPSGPNGYAGDFSPMVEPLTGPVAAVCAGARDRAREDRQTHRPAQKENVKALCTEPCGFPFALTFEEGFAPATPRIPAAHSPGPTWPHGNRPTTFRGAFRLFCSVFPFRLSLSETCFTELLTQV